MDPEREEQEIATSIIAIGFHYGFESQSIQCIEEMAELTQAITKLRRSRGIGQTTEKSEQECRDNVIEELADVYIMLIQMIYLMEASEEWYKKVHEKAWRQTKRIEEEKRENEDQKELGRVCRRADVRSGDLWGSRIRCWRSGHPAERDEPEGDAGRARSEPGRVQH